MLARKAPDKAQWTSSISKSKSHTGAIVGGAIGGVAVFLALGTIALVVRRRRRESQRRTSATVTVTESAYTQVLGSQTNQQQQIVNPFIPENPQRAFSDALSIPVGLTGKELAHLRSLANGSRPESTDIQPPPDSSSASNIDGDAHVPAAAEATLLPDAQRLWSEFDVLRNEVQQLQLRADRPEVPPTYASSEVA